MLTRAVDPIPPQGVPPEFQPARLFDGGVPHSRGMAAGDLDNDGNPDVVTAGGECDLGPGGAARIAIYLNSGDWEEEGFFDPNTPDLCTGCCRTQDVVVAELTGDTYLDIAATVDDPPRVVVFRNRLNALSQPGRLFDKSVIVLPNDSFAYGIVSADFDRDGANDLAVSSGLDPNNPPVVRVLLNEGDGTSFAIQSFVAEDDIGRAVELVLGRFDAEDFHLDLVTANIEDNSISQFFDQDEGIYTYKSVPGPGSGAPFLFNSIAAGKLDTDQLREVVGVESSDLYADVFRHDPNGAFIHERGATADSGDRYLAAPPDSTLWGVDIGHINIGTRRDLVVGIGGLSSGGEAGVLLGMGDGGFERDNDGHTLLSRYSLSPSGGPLLGDPSAVLLVDVNDDGQLDIVAASGGTISVLLNDSAP